MEVADVYIDNPTKSTTFHASSSYQFGGHLLQKLYDLFNEFTKLMKPNAFAFVNEKSARVPNLGKSIK